MKTLKNSIFVILCGILLLPAGPASAALEEIVVTAQKRAQSAQDVALSISAFDSETLREMNMGNDISRLANEVSNTVAYGTGTSIQSFHIRGIGLNEFEGNYDTPVAVNHDEIYMSKNWMAAEPVYDVERVEVLKGPQGTLFGRNTTGGAVNYYMNNPTRDFEAGLQAGVDDNTRMTTQGYVSGPLTDSLSGRLAFYIQGSDGGPWHNLYNNKDVGRQDRQLMRGKLLWDANDTTVTITLHGGKDHSDSVPYKGPGIFNLGAPGYCPQVLTGQVTDHPSACPKFAGLAALGGNPGAEYEPESWKTINQDYWPHFKHEFYGASARIEHDFGFTKLTSITAYEYFRRDDREDSDSSALVSANTNWFDRIGQFTQELRLSGDLMQQRWHYVLGAFYENDNLTEVDNSNLGGNPLGILPPFAPRLAADYNQDVESFAIFMHNEFKLMDTLTLNFGVRGTFDTVGIRGITSIAANDATGDSDRVTPVFVTTFDAAGIPLAFAPNGGYYKNKRHDSNFSYRTGLAWTPRDNMLVYANVSTGYRSGGYSVPFGGVITTFAPEDIFAQELGFKSRLVNDTVQLNAAIFHYDYSNLQVNVDDAVSPLVPITRNIGKSDSLGAEADVWWVPDDHWDLKAGVGYVDAKFKKTTRAITTYAGIIPLEGKTPVNTPKWNFNGSVRYQHPLSFLPNWHYVVSTDFRWTDKRYLEATNQVFDQADAYWIVNARGAIASDDGKWEIALWGKNVFDQKYLSYINNISFFKLDIFGEPATYGVNVSYSFK